MGTAQQAAGPAATQGPAPMPEAPIVELTHVCKSYGEGELVVPVLHDVSLAVARGDYVAIMGPSGSGKSTLMNIMGLLDVASSGSYRLEGREVTGLSDAELSRLRNREIGFVFQSFNLLPRESVLENVELPMVYGGVPRAERAERALQALRDVGLEARASFLPTQLSGGQRQRVAIARAMVMGPALLLADEPTGALDSASGEQVMGIFERLNEGGTTIVMITHEPAIAEHARVTHHIRDGRLVRTDEGEGGVADVG